MKPIIEWIEKYIKNLPPRVGGYRHKPEGGVPYTLDLYGTADTNFKKLADQQLKKGPKAPPKRSPKEINLSLEYLRKNPPQIK